MLSASLVLYNNDPRIFEPAIHSFLDGCDSGLIWVSDNSPEPIKSAIFSHSRVRYFKNESNLGFGAGHNRALIKAQQQSEFHLFLNPDIEFPREALPELIRKMRSDPCIGAMMPKIIYPDGSHQHLAKLLPNPLNLFLRRFIPIKYIRDIIDERYELRRLETDAPVEVPAISGCFLLTRTSVVHRIGGFDERYFMYMEDFDLVRRIAESHRILFVPTVTVTHHYAKGSYVNKTLLAHHIRSAIKYFNKWGWVFDGHRRHANRKIMRLIKGHLE